MMKNIFVTGGAGVIGRELVPLLLAKGYRVLVGDLKLRPLEFPKEVLYRQGDLNFMTAQELDAFSPDAIIHLAATFERSEESYEFWSENRDNNISLSTHILALANTTPSMSRFVFASSYLIYDPSLYLTKEPKNHPVSLSEIESINPRNLTGMAKLSHECEQKFFQGFSNTKFSNINARIFRGYGRGSRDVISRWVRSLLDDEDIVVYGSESFFDFIYSKDSASGLVALMESPSASGVVNLGTGSAKSINDVLNVLKSYFPSMKIRYESMVGFYEASEADMSLNHSLTGWKSSYDLKRAIGEIIEYEKQKIKNSSNGSGALTVLVSSGSKKIPLIQEVKKVVNSLPCGGKVIVGDANPGAISAFLGEEFWQMPRTIEENLESIIRGCLDKGISLILPTRDGELEFWSKNSKAFKERGIWVVVSALDSIQLCIDKLMFSKECILKGLEAINSSKLIDEIECNSYVVKERFGAGSQSIGLNLSREQALKHASALEHPIYQPFISGREISVDAWLDNSTNVVGVVLRRRDVIALGESQITTTFKDEVIEKAATEFLTALNLSGPVVLQAIIDGKGNFNVIEVNPRFGGASTTSIAAGLDLIRWSILEAMGENVEEYAQLRIKGEVRQIRVPADKYIYGDNF